MKPISTRAALWGPFFLVLAACTGPGTTPSPRRGDVITAEELAAVPSGNLYEAIERLRPALLRQRGVASIHAPTAGVPRVFVDNIEMGDLQVLRTINPLQVSRVERVSAQDATIRWGTGYMGGAILVFTHSGAAARR